MFEIGSDGTIRLTRGDTAEFTITVTQADGSPYILAEGDLLEFAVKEYPGGDNEVIYKTGQEITIEPADTEELPVKSYFYGVRITLSDGKVNTIIPKTQFIIENEVVG